MNWIAPADRKWIQIHRKGIIAILGAILDVAALMFPASPYVVTAVSAATAFGVYRVPNVRAPAKGEIVP